jgi:hypothetical protein
MNRALFFFTAIISLAMGFILRNRASYISAFCYGLSIGLFLASEVAPTN